MGTIALKGLTLHELLLMLIALGLSSKSGMLPERHNAMIEKVKRALDVLVKEELKRDPKGFKQQLEGVRLVYKMVPGVDGMVKWMQDFVDLYERGVKMMGEDE